MSLGLLGPLMFVGAFGLIFTGFPVAFALGGNADFCRHRRQRWRL